MVEEKFKDENEVEYSLEIRKISYGEECELEDKIMEIEVKTSQLKGENIAVPEKIKFNTAALRTWLPVFTVVSSEYPLVLKRRKVFPLPDGSAIDKDVEIKWEVASVDEKHEIICNLSPVVGKEIARLCTKHNKSDELFRSGV